MNLQFTSLFVLYFFAQISCDLDSPSPSPSPDRDYCKNPETESHGRLLEIVDRCSSENDDCSALSDCLSENLVKISEENMISCRKQTSEMGKSSNTPFRPCSVAATAYVILEQIRVLLVENTVYRKCTQVRNLFERVMKSCGGEEGTKLFDDFDPSTTTSPNEPNMNDMAIQEILARFLIGIGKKMQTYDIVREDIAELERSKHMKALGAMCISFALPGLLGLCEASHFRTGLVLQTLALFVIGIYQFSRYGGYWAFVGVGSCLLIMTIELALLILVKKKFFGENKDDKKME